MLHDYNPRSRHMWRLKHGYIDVQKNGSIFYCYPDDHGYDSDAHYLTLRVDKGFYALVWDYSMTPGDRDGHQCGVIADYIEDHLETLVAIQWQCVRAEARKRLTVAIDEFRERFLCPARNNCVTAAVTRTV